MEFKRRRVTFRLYPTIKQEALLRDYRERHRVLYNTLLKKWIDSYQLSILLNESDLCKEVTSLRATELAKINAQSCQVTAKRVFIACKSFLIKKQTFGAAGFPRFKSKERFHSFGFKTHGDGFRLASEGLHGSLRLSGVGNKIRMRGKARTWGDVATMDIVYKAGKWFSSISVKCHPFRSHGNLPCGIDLGLITHATAAYPDGSFKEIKNPRFEKTFLATTKLARIQKDLNRTNEGSKNRTRVLLKVQRLAAKIANQRNNHLHQISKKLVGEASLIATEKLNVKKMCSRHDKNKRGLNKSLLDASLATLYGYLRYKAEEAGIPFIEIATLRIKPSQTCSGCNNYKKKLLKQRIHACGECGLILSRDQNSARVILNSALADRLRDGNHPGVEGMLKSFPLKHETPASLFQ